MQTTEERKAGDNWGNMIALAAVVFSISTTLLGGIVTVSINYYQVSEHNTEIEKLKLESQACKETALIVAGHARDIAELKADSKVVLSTMQAVATDTKVMAVKLDSLIESSRKENNRAAARDDKLPQG